MTKQKYLEAYQKGKEARSKTKSHYGQVSKKANATPKAKKKKKKKEEPKQESSRPTGGTARHRSGASAKPSHQTQTNRAKQTTTNKQSSSKSKSTSGAFKPVGSTGNQRREGAGRVKQAASSYANSGNKTSTKVSTIASNAHHGGTSRVNTAKHKERVAGLSRARRAQEVAGDVLQYAAKDIASLGTGIVAAGGKNKYVEPDYKGFGDSLKAAADAKKNGDKYKPQGTLPKGTKLNTRTGTYETNKRWKKAEDVHGKVRASAEKELEDATKNISDKKQYNMPDLGVVNKVLGMESTKSQKKAAIKAQRAKDTEDYLSAKADMKKSLSDQLDEMAKQNGISNDTVLTNGQTYAQYKKSVLRGAVTDLYNEAVANREANAQAIKDSDIGKISKRDLTKMGIQLGVGFAEIGVPYLGTMSKALKGADVLLAASKGGAKALTKTGAKAGTKTLSSAGRNAVKNAAKKATEELASKGVEASASNIAKETMKQIAKSDLKQNVKREVLANALQDATIGSAYDYLTTQKEGLSGKEAWEYMGKSALMNAALGTPMAAIGGRTTKAGKTALANETADIFNAEIRNTNALTKAEKNELEALQYAKDGQFSKFTEADQARYDELMGKAKLNSQNAVEVTAKGRIAASSDAIGTSELTKAEAQEYLYLRQSADVRDLTPNETNRLVTLYNKIQETKDVTDRVANDAISVSNWSIKSKDQKGLESAVRHYELTGETAKLNQAQKKLEIAKKETTKLNNSIENSLNKMETTLKKNGESLKGSYKWVDDDEMTSLTGERGINGYYDEETGQIIVNRDSPMAYQTIVGHETMHLLKDANLEGYQKLADMLTEHVKKLDEYDALVEELQRAYPELKYKQEDFNEEVVAEMLGRYVFGDDDTFIKKLAGEDPTTLQRIIAYIKRLFSDSDNKELAEHFANIEKTALEEIKKVKQADWEARGLKEATGDANKRLSKAQIDKTSQLAPVSGKDGMYSYAYEAANQLGKTVKSDADSLLKYFQKKGVTAEEMKWTGLGDYIRANSPLSKQQLLDFIDANNYELYTVVRANEDYKSALGKKYNEGTREELRTILRNDRDLLEDISDTLGIGEREILEQPREALRAYGMNPNEMVEPPTVPDRAKWERFSLRGGKNYREYEYVDPRMTGYTNTAMGRHWSNDSDVVIHSRIQDFTEGTEFSSRTERLKVVNGAINDFDKWAHKNFDRLLYVDDTTSVNQTVFHHDIGEDVDVQVFNYFDSDTIENYPVVSVVTNDGDEVLFKRLNGDNEIALIGSFNRAIDGGKFLDKLPQGYKNNGGKVLHVEEIQSDWHNAGQKYGYNKDGHEAETATRISKLRQELDEVSQKAENLERESETLRKETVEIRRELRKAREERGDIEARIVTQLEREEGLPHRQPDNDYVDDGWFEYEDEPDLLFYEDYVDAPIGESDSAEIVALKKERDAIDAKIESLEKSAKTEEYTKYMDEIGSLYDRQAVLENEIYALNRGGANVPEAPYKNNYTDYAMKRALREAVENDYDVISWTTAKQQADRWSDEYMEGYRIEYDQDIPSFMKRYVKQWGGDVEKLRLAENGEEVWGVRITDEMRESIKTKGQKRFSKGGGKAQGIDSDAAKRAEYMYKEGKPVDKIFEETGFVVDTDGKAKFRFSDADMKLNVKTSTIKKGIATASREAKAARLNARLDELERQMASATDDAEVNRLFAKQLEISDELEKAESGIREYKLGNLITHDELFKYYPQFKDDIVVQFAPRSYMREVYGKDTDGVSVPNGDGTYTLVIDRNLSEDDLYDTIVHETQHAIQDLEGFSKGSSPEAWSAKVKDINARIKALEDKLPKNFVSNGKESYRKYLSDKEVDELFKLYEGRDNLSKDFYGTPESFRNKMVEDGKVPYKHTKGEFEARNAEVERTSSKEEMEAYDAAEALELSGKESDYEGLVDKNEVKVEDYFGKNKRYSKSKSTSKYESKATDEAHKKAGVSQEDISTMSDKDIKDEIAYLNGRLKRGKTQESQELRQARLDELNAVADERGINIPKKQRVDAMIREKKFGWEEAKEVSKEVKTLERRIKSIRTQAKKTGGLTEKQANKIRELDAKKREKNVRLTQLLDESEKTIPEGQSAKEAFRETVGGNALKEKGAGKKLNKAKKFVEENEGLWGTAKDLGFATRRKTESSLIEYETVGKTLMKNGDKELGQALLDQTNNVIVAKNKASAFIESHRASADGTRIGKSLNDVFTIKKDGRTIDLLDEANAEMRKDLSDYLFAKHSFAREKQGKKVFGQIDENGKPKWTNANTEAFINELKREYGEENLNAFERGVRDYINDLNQYRLDTGLISKEFLDELNDIYPYYVPTHRANVEKEPSAWELPKTIAEIDNGIKKAVGSGEELEDLYTQLAKMTVSTIRTGEQNKMIAMYAKAKNIDATRLPKETTAEDLVDSSISAFDSNGKGKWKVRYYEDGKAVEIPVNKHAAKGLREWNQQDYAALIEVSAKAGKLLHMREYKGLITDWNVVFGARNGMRDAQQALVNSKDSRWFVRSIPRAKAAVLNEDNAFRILYDANGGRYSTLQQINRLDEIGALNKGKSTVAKGLEKIEDFNGAIEMMPRMQEFIGTIQKEADRILGKKGVDELMREIEAEAKIKPESERTMWIESEYAQRIVDLIKKEKPDIIATAMRNASDITVNFSRSGVFTKALNAGFVPYLNPSVQGLSKMMRMFSESKTQGLAKLASFGAKLSVVTIAPAVANEILCKDNEAYQSLNTRDKDNNFFIPMSLFGGDKDKFIKIPKPRENAVLAEPVEYGLRWWLDKAQYGTKDEFEQMFDSAITNVGVVSPWEDNIVMPIINTAFRNRMWYGGKILTDQEVENAKEGYAWENFDETTSEFAKRMGKLANVSPKKVDVIMDSYLGLIYDYGISQTSQKNINEVYSSPMNFLKNNPITQQFTKDAVFSNKYATKFWDNVDKLNKGHEKGRDTIEKREYMAKYGYDTFTYDKAISAIDTDDSIPKEDKVAVKRELRKYKNQLLHRALDGKPVMYDPMQRIINLYERHGVKNATDKCLTLYAEGNHAEAYEYLKTTKEYRDASPAKQKDLQEKFLKTYKGIKRIARFTGDSDKFINYSTAQYVCVKNGLTGGLIANAYCQKQKPYAVKKGLENMQEYIDAGYTEKNFKVTMRALNRGADELGDDKKRYASQLDDYDKAMILAKKGYRDGAYKIASPYMGARMNAARCLTEGHSTKDYEWDDKRINEFCKKYKIRHDKEYKWDLEQVEESIRKEYPNKSAEEQADVFVVITGELENPFGEIGDYSHANDTGFEEKDDEKGKGGRRRRGRRRGYRGGGGGGGGGGGEMPTTASGTFDGKNTDLKVTKFKAKSLFTASDYTKPSNLNEAYRKKAKKLRANTTTRRS